MVGRYVKFTAQPGHEEQLAAALGTVAESLHGTAGCRLYVVNRAVEDPAAVWVTELWDSQAAVDASLAALQTDAGKAQLAEIMQHVAGAPERTDLVPLGGVGFVG